MAERIQESAESRGTNVDRRRQLEAHRKRPLFEHLDAFETYLRNKNNSDRYVSEAVRMVKAVLDGCGFRFISDLDSTPVEEWFAAQRTGKRNMSISTSNGYITAIKNFCNWMVRKRRMADNPLSDLCKLNGDADVRRERRDLPADEFNALIRAARSGETRYGLSGDDRAMLYLTAAYTGLRAREWSSLTRNSFDLQADPPTVTVEAGYSKHRRRDTLPLHPDLGARLREWFHGTRLAHPERRLWPGRWAEDRHAAAMLREDLDAAEVSYRDDAGRVFDFHALRHQFISTLARHGVHPKTAQELARHSSITLTMDHYAHVRLSDHRAALESLPSLPTGEPETAQATGTADGGDAVRLRKR